MRRWLTAACAALLAGCASAAAPPGGPEDHAPPKLVRVTPDTNAVNVTDKVATFYFDETINDRGSGATELSNFFLVSPSDGNARISWHRSRIEVRPRLGFRPNTAYSITLLPGLADLRGNVTRTGARVIFSTGATIPTLQITGTAFDWSAEHPAARALIQAVTADSTMYLAQSDSIGRFTIGPLPAGSFLVRAIIDANANRALDRTEAYDTVRVVAPQASPVELLAIVRDTLPPRIQGVTVVDSLSLRVTFDRPLSPGAIPLPSAFHVVGPDSVTVPVTAVLTPRQEAAAAEEMAKAHADSSRRADSLAARAAATTPAAPAASAPAASAAAPPAPVVPGGRGRPVAQVPVVKPSVPPPPTSLLLRIGHALPPNTLHRLYVTSATALSGRSMASDRGFTTPRLVTPKTGAADSTRARPATGTPAGGPATVPSPAPATARPAAPSTPPARPR